MYPPPEPPDGDIHILPEELGPDDKFFVCKVKLITRSQSQREAMDQILELLKKGSGLPIVLDFGYASTGPYSPRFYPLEVDVTQEFLDLKAAAQNENENYVDPEAENYPDKFQEEYNQKFDALGEDPATQHN